MIVAGVLCVVVAAAVWELLGTELLAAALVLTAQSDSGDGAGAGNDDKEAAPGAAAAAETAAATPQPISFWRASTIPGVILYALC